MLVTFDLLQNVDGAHQKLDAGEAFRRLKNNRVVDVEVFPYSHALPPAGHCFRIDFRQGVSAVLPREPRSLDLLRYLAF